MKIPLLSATVETVYMVFMASFIGIVIGLLSGVFLYITGRNQIRNNHYIYYPLAFLVNTLRSIPFIILMISILPLTRLLVGTSIGTNAAIVPMAITAAAFFARVAENALQALPISLMETAHSLGANTQQIIFKFLLPEASPSLIRGATLTIIGLIGYSTMAGVVGGGGLGELAINYGYQRFDAWVMLQTVVMLLLIVLLVQYAGDSLAKKRNARLVSIVSVIFFIGLLLAQIIPIFWINSPKHLRVGIISGPMQTVMQVAKQVAEKKYHLHLDVVAFNDYVLPNTALNNGHLDANIFQHLPYLKMQIKSQGYHLTAIAKTFIYPMGIFSKKISRLSQLADNAWVALPNDPSNQARALLLLQKARLIQLKTGVSTSATLRDIIDNPKRLRFRALDAAELPRVFDDVTLVALTNDFIQPTGLSLADALIRESKHSPYANVIVVRQRDRNRPTLKQLVQVMHSRPVEHVTMSLFPRGAAIPAW